MAHIQHNVVARYRRNNSLSDFQIQRKEEVSG